jgi:hypothetical protein
MISKRYVSIAAALLLASNVFAWQKAAHLITLPLIEGGGIYTAVVAIRDSPSLQTRTPAITTLSLLGVNAAAGVFTLLGPKENYPVMRIIHRSLGFAITAAAIWLSVAEAGDPNVKDATRTVAYGYTGLTMVPLIIFNF